MPGDEGRDRNVAGMAARARDPERATAQTAKPPPFEPQLRFLPGSGLGLAGALQAVLEQRLKGGFRDRLR